MYKKSEQRIEVLQTLSNGQWYKLNQIPYQMRVYDMYVKRAQKIGRPYDIKEYYKHANQGKTSLLYAMIKEGYVERRWANRKWYLYRITQKGLIYLNELEKRFMG